MTTKAALVALCLPGMAQAVTCRDDIFEDASYSVCEVAPGEDLRLFLNGPDGPYGSFAALVTGLEPTGLTLDFAMNAGMFHEDLAPVGLSAKGAHCHLGRAGQLWSAAERGVLCRRQFCGDRKPRLQGRPPCLPLRHPKRPDAGHRRRAASQFCP